MKSTKQSAAQPSSNPVANKSRQLEVETPPGVTEDQMVAQVLTQGEAACASTTIAFSAHDHANVSLTDLARALTTQGKAVNTGDLSESERLLSSQVVAMNAMFNELARRAALNMGTHLPATEIYLRLALKAQAQCRSTVEALAEMKNPRAVAFVKQANISGGPQQVNNAPSSSAPVARAEETKPKHNKLLEAQRGKWLDAGTKSTAGRVDQDLEAVGVLNGADDRSRESGSRAERVEGRDSAGAS